MLTWTCTVKAVRKWGSISSHERDFWALTFTIKIFPTVLKSTQRAGNQLFFREY
jgi:hypothetical protein